MVGLFMGLTKSIKKAGAELVVIEKKEELIDKFPDLPITTDPSNDFSTAPVRVLYTCISTATRTEVCPTSATPNRNSSMSPRWAGAMNSASRTARVRKFLPG